jgi:two-component system, cell cycle sensor histidine kinase and response regulator CckA
VQIANLGIVWVILGGSFILLAFAIGYVLLTVSSHQRVLQAQKARLAEVLASEEKYRGLFDNALAGIMKLSPETWEIQDSNEAIRSIFGCSSQIELQNCILELPLPSLHTIRQSLTANGVIAGLEIHTTRRTGEDLWILFAAKTTNDDSLAQAVVVDISKLKEFEEKTKEQSALLDQTRDAIMVVDGSGVVTFWNSGAELTYGWSRDAMLGQSIREMLYSGSKKGDFQEAMEDISLFGEWNGQHSHQRKDGKEILVESRWRTVKRGTGGKNAVLIVNSDVTEKKRLEGQFIRARKMESIALLTGGMAHDLQNILAPISLSIPLLRKRLSDESGLAILQVVEESARSGLDLVKNIMTYGRGIAGERVTLNVDFILDQVLIIVKQSLPASIKIERRSNGRPALISGDLNQLKQVFLNLCVNARDAMPTGGRLTLEIAHVETDDTLMESHPDADPGPYVVVHVADTGSGIAEENLDRIFEPFFTTREQGEGTGLGLSIAHGIVQSHNGYITVKSAVGGGTSFRVYLPCLDS